MDTFPPIPDFGLWYVEMVYLGARLWQNISVLPLLGFELWLKKSVFGLIKI
jgi:hypothetical protein